MKRIGLILLFSLTAMNAVEDSTTVYFQVDAIDELTVSGDPGTLVVSTATAGFNPDIDTDSTTTYALTTNGTSSVVTASMDVALTNNNLLYLTLTAPATGISVGPLALTTSAQNLVTGITPVAESPMTITYELDCDIAGNAAKTMPLTHTVVTLTVQAS